MPANICVPLFKGGSKDLTVRTTAPVVGKTFAAISADIQSGPVITTAVLPTTYDGGNLQAATCGAGIKPDGVFGYDQVSGGVVPLIRPKAVAPVTAGAAITAGQEVMSDVNGNAIPVALGSATAATLNTGTVGSNNALTFTAHDSGGAGNGISISLHDPGAASQALGVVVTGNDIVVNLATNGSSVITSTATLVAAAIAASGAAAALVTAANTGVSTGAGVVTAVAPTNLSGGSEAVSGKAAGKATTSAASTADCFVELY